MTDLECLRQIVTKTGSTLVKNLPSYFEHTDNPTLIGFVIAIGLGNKMYHEYRFDHSGNLIFEEVMYF